MPSSAPSGQYELSYISGYKGTHSSCALFHPILEDVAIYSIGSLVVISSIRDPRKQQLLKNHNEDVCTIAVSPNGEFIASGQKGSQYYSKNAAPVVISHFKTGEKVLQLDGLCKQVLALSFSPDSRFLAASGANGIFYVWNVLTGAVVVSKRAEASVTSIAWGEMITSYNQSSDKNGGYHHDSYQSSVADMVLSKNPTYFLCSSNGAHVRYHRLVYSRKKMQYLLNTNNCALPSRGLHRDFTSLVMDPSLRYILCGSDAGEFINFQIGNESASRRKYFDNENDAMGSIGMSRFNNILFIVCVYIDVGKCLQVRKCTFCD